MHAYVCECMLGRMCAVRRPPFASPELGVHGDNTSAFLYPCTQSVHTLAYLREAAERLADFVAKPVTGREVSYARVRHYMQASVGRTGRWCVQPRAKVHGQPLTVDHFATAQDILDVAHHDFLRSRDKGVSKCLHRPSPATRYHWPQPLPPANTTHNNNLSHQCTTALLAAGCLKRYLEDLPADQCRCSPARLAVRRSAGLGYGVRLACRGSFASSFG